MSPYEFAYQLAGSIILLAFERLKICLSNMLKIISCQMDLVGSTMKFGRHKWVLITLTETIQTIQSCKTRRGEVKDVILLTENICIIVIMIIEKTLNSTFMPKKVNQLSYGCKSTVYRLLIAQVVQKLYLQE